MGIDTGYLGCDVGAYTQGPAAAAVGEFAGQYIEIGTQSHQQGVGELHQGRDNVTVTPTRAVIEQGAPQGLDRCRLLRQQLIDAVGQQPPFVGDHDRVYLPDGAPASWLLRYW